MLKFDCQNVILIKLNEFKNICSAYKKKFRRDFGSDCYYFYSCDDIRYIFETFLSGELGCDILEPHINEYDDTDIVDPDYIIVETSFNAEQIEESLISFTEKMFNTIQANRKKAQALEKDKSSKIKKLVNKLSDEEKELLKEHLCK